MSANKSARATQSMLSCRRPRTRISFFSSDGLGACSEAINTIWPEAIVQTCVVHLLRNSYRYSSRRDYDAL